MRITAQDLIDLNIIDAIIPEPMGGAHRAPEKAIDAAGDAIERALRDLCRPQSRRIAAPAPRKIPANWSQSENAALAISKTSVVVKPARRGSA